MAFNAFRAFKGTEVPEASGNKTMTRLPASLLDAFIPGYSVIAQFSLDILGFDITLAVSVCLLLFGLATSLRFIWSHASEQFQHYCVSYVRIFSDDDIYDQVMDWIATQNFSKRSLTLIARTDREDDDQLIDEHVQTFDPNAFVNFSKMDAKIPPKFLPAFGTHLFFHQGYLFSLKRGQKQVMANTWGGTTIRDEEDMTLACVGRSTAPIKNLIAEARRHFLSKDISRTCVRRPAPKEIRSRARYWQKVSVRPSRPIETIVLDHEEKEKVLKDINEYLQPATKLWYAHRGIPYRRGYLFHGPPGTGKTSLAWAIAGVFGLDMYCMSLVDPTLTEEDLSMMFSNLPHRCVVLLEDVDSAGLKNREKESTSAVKQGDDQNSNDAAKIGAEITKALASVSKNAKNDNNKQGITLSGLLNAIDGVASHEGRVLVMTTNYPEKLDDALIRPGRIDMKVQFTHASRIQIYELFTRMYSPDVKASELIKMSSDPFKLRAAPTKEESPHSLQASLIQQPQQPSAISNPLTGLKQTDLTPPQTPEPSNTPTTTTSSTPPPAYDTASTSLSTSTDLDPSADLETIAERFASILPEDTFTPAEIQGFLLTRKKEPLRALEEVAEWRDATIEAKEKKKLKVAQMEGEA